MSEMLERMKNALAATAVWPPQGDHPVTCDCARCVAFRKQARAVLLAMREPTPEVAEAGRQIAWRAADAWRAMIDAAQGEDLAKQRQCD